MARTYGKAQDLIDFTRTSGGTALRRVKYGAELVTNGTFDSDLSGWNTGSNVTSVYSSGTAQLTLGGALTSTALNWFWTEEVFEAGKVFIVTFDATYVSGGYLQGGYGYNEGVRVTSSGSYSFTVNPLVGSGTQTNRNMLTFGGDSGAVWKIDNISVKEVTFDTSDGDLILFNHPKNIPRIEYDANGNLLGLLVEESRTNLITYSEDYTQSFTGGSVSGFTLNSGIAPDQTNTVNLHNLESGADFVYGIYSVSANTSYTFTQWVALGTASEVAYAIYDASNLTWIIGQQNYTGLSSELTKKSITFTTPSGCTSIRVYPLRYINSANLGTTYHWGAQLEAGSFPTSYIPTSGSTATRSADVASLSTSAFGYNQEKGTLMVEGSRPYSMATSEAYASLAGSDANRFTLYIQGTTNYVNGYTRGQAGASTLFGPTANIGGFDKWGMTYDIQDGFVLAVNESEEHTTTATNADFSGKTALWIGNAYSGAPEFSNGHIKSIKYIPRRLTNDQLVELTS